MTTKFETETKALVHYEWNIANTIAEARAAGFTVIQATETTLLLDLDDDVAEDIYERTLPRLASLYELCETERWRSKSGIGLHVVLSCHALPFPERAALQACLGSDRIREGIAIRRHLDGNDNPSFLFKPKS